MQRVETILTPEVTAFVRAHVRSLVTWDILAFFHRSPDAVSDLDGLALRLGRLAAEVVPEIDDLCQAGILVRAGGLIRYRPDAAHRSAAAAMVRCGQDEAQRRALMALMLGRSNPPAGSGI